MAVCSKVQLIIGQVTITTAVPAARVAITWRGTILGSDLAGEYVVRCDNPKVKEASRHQVGVWSCKLVRPLSAPNPDEAGAAWVYNDGTEEGPLTAETFDQRLNDGEPRDVARYKAEPYVIAADVYPTPASSRSARPRFPVRLLAKGSGCNFAK